MLSLSQHAEIDTSLTVFHFWYCSIQATSFDQLWREHSAYLSELKETTSHPVLPRAPSSELENAKKDEELEHMRQKLHALGEQKDKERQAAVNAEKRKDKERQAAANAEKMKMETQNKKMKAQIEVCNLDFNCMRVA